MPKESEEETIINNAAELENPPLPSKFDEFGGDIKAIHNTALEIIKLQEIAKQNGKLTEAEETKYQQNVDALNTSAQNLAAIQEQSNGFEFENREGLSAWFERKKSSSQGKKDKNKKKDEDELKKKKEEEEEKKRKEEEERRKEEEKEKEEEEENVDESEAEVINLPPEDASVAEAKPVGLAIAGEGGVAASKPIATAVVGPGGLAIARPVGTAIAGVAPDQALVPLYVESYIHGHKPSRKHSSSSATKTDPTSEYLNKIIHKYHNV